MCEGSPVRRHFKSVRDTLDSVGLDVLESFRAALMRLSERVPHELYILLQRRLCESDVSDLVFELVLAGSDGTMSLDGATAEMVRLLAHGNEPAQELLRYLSVAEVEEPKYRGKGGSRLSVAAVDRVMTVGAGKFFADQSRIRCIWFGSRVQFGSGIPVARSYLCEFDDDTQADVLVGAVHELLEWGLASRLRHFTVDACRAHEDLPRYYAGLRADGELLWSRPR